MPDKKDQRPLSKKKRGYLLAILGGSFGGPLGLITSPLVLYFLNKKVKSKESEDLSNLRNSQFEQEDPYEYYALQYVEIANTSEKFTAREVLCHDMFYRDPEKIKKIDLTAMGKSLARIGCISAGQSNKKGDRSRYWTKPEK